MIPIVSTRVRVYLDAVGIGTGKQSGEGANQDVFKKEARRTQTDTKMDRKLPLLPLIITMEDEDMLAVSIQDYLQ